MRTTCTLFAVVLGGLAASGCVTSEPTVATCYSANGTPDQCAVVRQTTVTQYNANAQAADNQFAAELRSVCLSYGLQPGTALYTNCLAREADSRRGTSYAGHFTQPGYLYDQQGNRVDAQGYLIDRNGQRIGGRGYWIKGAGENVVPPGTYVNGQGQAVATNQTVTTTYVAPAPQMIQAQPTRRAYPYSNSSAVP